MNRLSAVAIVALVSTAYAGNPDVHKVNGSIVITAGQSAGDASTVNGSIEVAPGESLGSVSTVNGSIRIGDKDIIRDAHTVNGHITLGTAAVAQSVRTVNGAVEIGPGARVAGAVRTTNGAISLAQSADVSGSVASINGRIRVDAAHVGSGIESASGDIDIEAHSNVEGGILIRANHGSWSDFWSDVCSNPFGKWLSVGGCRTPLVVIGPDSVVQGPLQFERPVRLYVSTSARIGNVQGATAIRYSGDHPPVN